MITGSSRESETLAALNAFQGLLVLLHRKGVLSEQEINDLLTGVSDDMVASPLVQAKGAAQIVTDMKQRTLGH